MYKQMGVGCAPLQLDLLERAESGPLARVADLCFTSGVGKPSICIAFFLDYKKTIKG